MQADVLIVGQGMSGTLLSWALRKEGKSFLVIDDCSEQSASKVAAGIINPVTGRRYVRSWMVEELMDFAKQTYTEIGAFLQTVLLYGRNIIDFFPSPQMRNAFVDRLSENDTYLHAYPDQNRFNDYFNYDFGCGEVAPAFTVNVPSLLSLWRSRLIEWNVLKEEPFVLENLVVNDDGVRYGTITAQKIVFCDGFTGTKNPWFSRLPFSANKGEALLIECKGLPTDHVLKKGLLLAPLSEEGQFWVGSNYQWEFENSLPTAAFLQSTQQVLNGWLKLPYKVLHHKAAVRTATVERRPFIGFHPVFENVGILNGLGTKGTSLAPLFAHQLAQHIVHGFPLLPHADVRRFSRILSA